MDKQAKIYVAGHNGMVGSAITRKLKAEHFTNLLYKDHCELDLTRQADVEQFFEAARPEYVFLAAARVGSIRANIEHPAEFYYLNAMIANNVIHSAFKYDVKKLLYLSSSCVYPRLADQPITEDALLTGTLEPTNEAYAIAKIAGLKMCDYYREQYGCNFISAMPTSLYGINDNFDPVTGHFIPGLIRKFHDAKIRQLDHVVLWGTGKPYREMLYVDDLADALLFLMEHYDEKGHVNVGTGEDLSILEYANMIKKIVGYEGRIEHDLSQPDGMPKKQLDVSKMNAMGWRAKTDLEQGLRAVYDWYLTTLISA